MNAVSLISHHYNDTAIEQRQADSYLNATAMCQANGKLFAHYSSNASTQEYLEALSADIGLDAG